MALWPVLFAALVLQGPADQPPPLTEEQKTRIRELVRTTQEESTRLKARLQESQQDLARHYGEYDLDVEAVKKLEAEIIDLQRQMLAGYHKMQVDLRTVVGRERFRFLKQRIDNALNPPEPKKK